jgi:hypothetical protein
MESKDKVPLPVAKRVQHPLSHACPTNLTFQLLGKYKHVSFFTGVAKEQKH